MVIFLEKISEAKRAYLNGPRVAPKLKGRSTVGRHKVLLDTKNRNVHTA